MPIIYKKTVAILEEICEIEDAETMLEWLLEHPKGKLNLKQLRHTHSALLQILMALRPTVSIWPEDEGISEWLRPLMGESS